MARSRVPASENDRRNRVNVGVGPAHLADAEPSVKARMLRELAVWYRALAERAGNPVIWESRLLTADDLETEASRIDPQQEGDIL